MFQKILEAPIILDDVVPKQFQEDIKTLFFGNMFPWYFISNISSTESGKTFGFNHEFCRNGVVNSTVFDFIKQLPLYPLSEIGIDSPQEILVSRTFLHMPNAIREVENDGIHIDLPNPHIVCLYYVNDSDGDTFMFGKNKNDPISQKITPKQGRVVLFDGMIYHASSAPTKQPRCIINFDLKI